MGTVHRKGYLVSFSIPCFSARISTENKILNFLLTFIYGVLYVFLKRSKLAF